jgi:hypothetical protein
LYPAGPLRILGQFNGVWLGVVVSEMSLARNRPYLVRSVASRSSFRSGFIFSDGAVFGGGVLFVDDALFRFLVLDGVEES